MPPVSNRYTARINLVTNHISDNLTKDLTLNALAQVAAFSAYHFHRLFKLGAGENLSDFVARRRLERAIALMKASRSRSLTQIALECGFSELSAFSRAFKAQYGMAPSAWNRSEPLQESKIRQAPHDLALYTAEAMEQLAQDRAFDVTIREQPAQQLAYIRVQNPYAQPERIVQAYASLLAWVDARTQRGTLIGMSQDDPDVTPPELCRYDVCMTVPETLQADDGVSVRTLPACCLATLHCIGDIAQVDKAWQYLYRHWLPNSGYVPDNLPAMEIYVRTPNEIGWEHFDLECAIAIVPM
jgi:AraC family transcriptional regulator